MRAGKGHPGGARWERRGEPVTGKNRVNERREPVSAAPEVPQDVTGEELHAEARAELRTLPKELATKVARHLVMAGRLIEEDPATAYLHAKEARRLASRVGVVREAAGLAAYHAGQWADALAELRAARRLHQTEDAYLPILADCERGLGRPERALELAKSPAARRLSQADRVELRIVESGARRDMGQPEAAVVTLQIPELRDTRLRPWSTRLFYAYADALLEAGRKEEAGEWFARAAAADREGETDAAERYAELEGLQILDLEDEEPTEPAPSSQASGEELKSEAPADGPTGGGESSENGPQRSAAADDEEPAESAEAEEPKADVPDESLPESSQQSTGVDGEGPRGETGTPKAGD